MTTLTAISKSEHLLARWTRYGSFSFAAGQAVVPLVAQELPRAAGAFPVGFVREADAFVPVAVMGLEQGQNLFVAADGRWAGRYIPAACRGYPFTLASLRMQPKPLRQWLSILHRQYRLAGWPNAIWPAWVEEARPLHPRKRANMVH